MPQRNAPLFLYTVAALYGMFSASIEVFTMAMRPTIRVQNQRGKAHGADARPAGAPRASEHVYGVPVPDGLHEAIESERDNLSKAESLLACLAISMESEVDPVDEPYYPDIARLARQLVKQSINGLDSLTLQQLLMRDKIKEEPWIRLPSVLCH
jgi:hypothetical protein